MRSFGSIFSSNKIISEVKLWKQDTGNQDLEGLNMVLEGVVKNRKLIKMEV